MKLIDLSGNRYGRLLVLERSTTKVDRVHWLSKCDCGDTAIVSGKNLRSGNTKSCGCISSEKISERNVKRAKHGMTGTPTFVSWDSMRQRCLNENHKSYKNYGGRDISICKRWLNSFENFLEDMGERPDSTTLDRKDNDGDYSPENCRWATYEEQGNNRSTNKLITFRGETMTIVRLARKYGIDSKALMYRLNNGWNIEDALMTKVNHGNGWKRGVRT